MKNITWTHDQLSKGVDEMKESQDALVQAQVAAIVAGLERHIAVKTAALEAYVAQQIAQNAHADPALIEKSARRSAADMLAQWKRTERLSISIPTEI